MTEKNQMSDELRGRIEEIDLRFELYERASQVYQLLRRRKLIYAQQGLEVYAPELSKLINWADKFSEHRGSGLCLRVLGILLRRLERRIAKLEKLQSKQGSFSSVFLKLRQHLSIHKGTPAQYQTVKELLGELGECLAEPDRKGTK